VRPLHLHLLVNDPTREEVAALVASLRGDGHFVATDAAAVPPAGVPAAADFVVSDAAAQPVPESLAAAEARHLVTMLRHTGGNRRQAAILLGIARSTLLAKIRKYGL
jgi:DNA-binding NtrC family response regulator